MELIDFLQKWIGYCLTATRPNTSSRSSTGQAEQANRRSQMWCVNCLGQYARHSPMDTFLVARGERHPTDLAGFAGARLVTAVETDEGRPWDEPNSKPSPETTHNRPIHA